MKKIILSMLVMLFVLLASLQIFAGERKVLLISDIDDTIKVANILGPVGKVARATNIMVPFTGMAELYDFIVYQNVYTTKVVYLSNAPQTLAGVPLMTTSHQEFLKMNEFPAGQLLLRENTQVQNHKINSIRRLVSEQNPDLVLLFGDNGEKDIEIYAQAAKELNAQGIQTETYIHQLYSSNAESNHLTETLFPEVISSYLRKSVGKAIQPGQFGFVTPVEIALDLKNKNLITQATLNWLVKKIVPDILNESFYNLDTLGAVTFPSFKDCSDYKWTVPVPEESLLSALVLKINKQCR